MFHRVERSLPPGMMSARADSVHVKPDGGFLGTWTVPGVATTIAAIACVILLLVLIFSPYYEEPTESIEANGKLAPAGVDGDRQGEGR